MTGVYISTSVLEDELPADTAVTRLIDAGFSRIEIGSTHVFAEDYLNRLVSLKSRASFTVHNYFPPAEKPMVLNLASRNKIIRENSLKQVKESIEFSSRLGADLYSFHAGFIGDAETAGPDKNKRSFDFVFQAGDLADKAAIFEVFIDSLKEICDYAARYDMKIACENDGSISKNHLCLMNTADLFMDMFERVDYPLLGMLLDLGHLRLASTANHYDPRQFITAVKSRVYELHIHENDGVCDQHSFLYPGCVALELLQEFDFSSAIMTLEGRNLTQDQIAASYQLLCDARNICGTTLPNLSMKNYEVKQESGDLHLNKIQNLEVSGRHD